MLLFLHGGNLFIGPCFGFGIADKNTVPANLIKEEIEPD